MGYQPDVPGPGEDDGPNNVPTEPVNHPVPVGEQAASPYQRDWRRSTHEITAWRISERDHTLEPCGTDRLRRTGTDHPIVALGAEDSTERRADHSVNDGVREQPHDPSQDDAGSQPD